MGGGVSEFVIGGSTNEAEGLDENNDYRSSLQGTVQSPEHQLRQ